MRTRKVNIGIAPSRNYDKVTIEILEETIEFVNEFEFKKKVAEIFDVLNSICDEEYKKIQ